MRRESAARRRRCVDRVAVPRRARRGRQGRRAQGRTTLDAAAAATLLSAAVGGDPPARARARRRARGAGGRAARRRGGGRRRRGARATRAGSGRSPPTRRGLLRVARASRSTDVNAHDGHVGLHAVRPASRWTPGEAVAKAKVTPLAIAEPTVEAVESSAWRRRRAGHGGTASRRARSAPSRARASSPGSAQRFESRADGEARLVRLAPAARCATPAATPRAVADEMRGAARRGGRVLIVAGRQRARSARSRVRRARARSAAAWSATARPPIPGACCGWPAGTRPVLGHADLRDVLPGHHLRPRAAAPPGRASHGQPRDRRRSATAASSRARGLPLPAVPHERGARRARVTAPRRPALQRRDPGALPPPALPRASCRTRPRVAEDVNPLCGDRVRMRCGSRDGAVADARFTGDSLRDLHGLGRRAARAGRGQPAAEARELDDARTCWSGSQADIRPDADEVRDAARSTVLQQAPRAVRAGSAMRLGRADAAATSRSSPAIVNGHRLVYLDSARLQPEAARGARGDAQLLRARATPTCTARSTRWARRPRSCTRRRATGSGASSGRASREEIIFTRGTTEGINLVAQALGRTLQPGDEILVTEMEHHSNLIPWQMACRDRGAGSRPSRSPAMA